MAQYYQPPQGLPALCTSQYSILHQERLYLLKALADEEERGERLTKALETLKSKLEKIDIADPHVSARKLKQAIKSIRHKLGKCQYRERALSGNLTNVVAQMEGMKRYQWRSAHQQYSHHTQYGQMMMMSPATPTFMLQSPLTSAITAQMQYMALNSPRNLNLYHSGTYNPYPSGTMSQVPQTPILHPAAMGYQLQAHLQRAQWTTEQGEAETSIQSPVSSISPFDLMPFSSLPEEFEYDAISPLSKAQQRPWSWPSVASADPEAEEKASTDAKADEGGLARRLSATDSASCGIRLDRLTN